MVSLFLLNVILGIPFHLFGISCMFCLVTLVAIGRHLYIWAYLQTLNEERDGNLITERRLRQSNLEVNDCFNKYSDEELATILRQLRDLSLKKRFRRCLSIAERNLCNRFPVSFKLLYQRTRVQRLLPV
jgi:hypothetical protein